MLGAQYLCQAGLAEAFTDPFKALDFTALQVEHILRRELGKNKGVPGRHFDEVEALYHYLRGELMYFITHSNLKIEDCNMAISELDLSIKIREGLYPNGHSDLVRSYISKGNGHNMMKDICQHGSQEWNRNSDIALQFYKKALDMRRNLSHSDLHFDFPQILENIGTILVQKKRYDEAEEYFLKAIALEKVLQVDGLYNTTTKFVNIGALYQTLKKYDKAYEYYYQAYKIRKALKGDHKDTVLAIYRMAVAKHSSREFENAILLYQEAYQMDESLLANYHSSARKDIRRYMLKAMDSAYKYEMEPQKKSILDSERHKWRTIFDRMVSAHC